MLGDTLSDRPDLRIGVLGPLAIARDGHRIDVPVGQLRALLASLLISPGQAVPVDVLADRLWPGRMPVRAGAAVHTYVARLRGRLGRDAIRTGSGGGYQISATAEHVDLWRWRELLRQAERAASAEAELATLREALGLWRGRPFLDVDSTWLHREVVPGLTDEWVAAVERRMDLEQATAPPAKLIPELRELIAAHPARESLWRRLIEALYRSGRRVEALDTYREVRAVLAEEFGLDPSDALQQLHRTVLLDGAAPAPAMPVPAATRPVRQLPHDIASFCGRRELTQLERLASVAEHSARGTTTIVAIDGAPGTGKTTLAVHWAHRLASDFPDLQLYVNLRGYGPGEPMSAASAAESLLRGLGVPSEFIPAEIEERSALLRSSLAGRRALMLLDNARDPDQVRPLLPGGDSLVIITSRSQLRGLAIRDGAHRVTLDRMTADEARAMLAAVIGIERVTAEADQAALLAELCDRLPLALAIVAEHALRANSLRDVVRALLEEKARLDMFGAGEDDPHTDLRAALSWSYRALDPVTAAMFRKLGLHPADSIDLTAAAVLAGLPVRQAQQSLDRLAAAHLVRERRRHRYQLHDLIRRYATERAEHDEPPASRSAAVRRVLDWYLHAVAGADQMLVPNRSRDFLAPYEPSAQPPRFTSTEDAVTWFVGEYDCLRSVVSWAGANGWAGHAWRIAIAAATLFDGLVPWREGIDFYTSALRAAERAGEPLGTAFVLNSLGCIYLDKEDGHPAERYLRQALTLFHACGHRRGEAMASGNLAIAQARLGNHQQAIRYSARALTLSRQLNHRRGVGLNFDNLGLTFASAGKHRQAIACYRRADTIFRETADVHNIGVTQRNLGLSYTSVGDMRNAVRAFREAVAAFRTFGSRRWEAIVLVDLGKCLRLAGHTRIAAGVLETALRTMGEFADPTAKEIKAILDQTPTG